MIGLMNHMSITLITQLLKFSVRSSASDKLAQDHYIFPPKQEHFQLFLPMF